MSEGASFARVDLAAWRSFLDGARGELRGATSLEAAMQIVCTMLGSSFAPTTALVRGYALVERRLLPPDVATFADAVAARSGHEALPDTPVLTLLGTYGAREAWRDRKQSEGHVGIPLLSADFVAGAPMVARLLKELGVDLAWLDEIGGGSTRKLMGGFNGTFFVKDAADERDERGRHVIPARAFVEEEAVRTVFGVGGFYPNGTLVVFIVFTREMLTQAQVGTFQSLITMFKGETFQICRSGRIFA